MDEEKGVQKFVFRSSTATEGECVIRTTSQRFGVFSGTDTDMYIPRVHYSPPLFTFIPPTPYRRGARVVVGPVRPFSYFIIHT